MKEVQCTLLKNNYKKREIVFGLLIRKGNVLHFSTEDWHYTVERESEINLSILPFIVVSGR